MQGYIFYAIVLRKVSAKAHFQLQFWQFEHVKFSGQLFWQVHHNTANK